MLQFDHIKIFRPMIAQRIDRKRFPALVGHPPSFWYEEGEAESEVDGMRLQLERIEARLYADGACLDTLQNLFFRQYRHAGILYQKWKMDSGILLAYDSGTSRTRARTWGGSQIVAG